MSVSPEELVREGGMPAVMYSASVGVVPVRARLNIFVARSRAAGGRVFALGREELGDGPGDGPGSALGTSDDGAFCSGVAELGGGCCSWGVREEELDTAGCCGVPMVG